MSIQSTLRAKRVVEVIPVVLDYTKFLLPGEIVIAASAEVQVFSGEDPAPNAMLATATTFTDFSVSQQIKEGLPGVVYQLIITADTSEGRGLYWYAKLAVIPDGPPATDLFIPVIFTSRPYPIEDIASIIAQQDLRQVVGITPDVGEVLVGQSFVSADLYGTLKIVHYNNWPWEGIEVATTFIDAELDEILITYDNWPVESVLVAQALELAVLYGNGVTYDNWPPENVEVTQTLVSADFYV